MLSGNQGGYSAFPLRPIHLQKKINIVKISHVVVVQHPAESTLLLQKHTVDGNKMVVLHQCYAGSTCKICIKDKRGNLHINVTMRCFRETTVVVENNKYYIF